MINTPKLPASLSLQITFNFSMILNPSASLPQMLCLKCFASATSIKIENFILPGVKNHWAKSLLCERKWRSSQNTFGMAGYWLRNAFPEEKEKFLWWITAYRLIIMLAQKMFIVGYYLSFGQQWILLSFYCTANRARKIDKNSFYLPDFTTGNCVIKF